MTSLFRPMSSRFAATSFAATLLAAPAAFAADPPDMAKQAEPQVGIFSLAVENDLFYDTDRRYTSGVRFSYLTPKNGEKKPAADSSADLLGRVKLVQLSYNEKRMGWEGTFVNPDNKDEKMVLATGPLPEELEAPEEWSIKNLLGTVVLKFKVLELDKESVVFQVDGTEGSAVAGLRDCKIQHRATTPRPVWNPDIPSPIDFRETWMDVPDNAVFDNAFKAQWELFLKHVALEDPFPWDFAEAAKGVQLAELGLRSWKERRWLDVPELD